MADIKETQKEILLDYADEMNLDTGLRECPGVDAAAMTELPEYVEKKLDEVLAAYIGDDRNYVVDGASIQCSEAAPGPATLTRIYDGTTRLRNILYSEGSWKIVNEVSRNTLDSEKEMLSEIFFGLVEHEEPKKLFALHATQSSDNGIRFATVVDRTCLRDIKEGTEHLTSPIEGELSSEACIVSCGNCGILKESDIDEIEKRLVESIEYGTCYSLIKPIQEWINPYSIESIVENQENGSVKGVLLPSIGGEAVAGVGHHRIKEFSTKYGPKEGLTMLSTLLCTRGGVITIKVHGQIYLEPENVKEKILELLEMDNGLELVEEYIKKIKSTYPEYDTFLELLAQAESRGNGGYEADNGSYFGRYQIGWLTFEQIGFAKEENEWTELANSFGVYDLETFKKSEVAQEVAILFALRWDYQQIVSYGDDKYMGGKANGVDVTLSGLVAAGHLAGTYEVHKGFTGEKAWDDVHDGNGTKATTYMNNMKGLDIKGILVGIE